MQCNLESPWTGEDRACPFCRASGRSLFSIRYSDTVEANHNIADVTGHILSCSNCGICYPSTNYDPNQFSALYAKSLGDLSYFHASPLQKMRQRVLATLMRHHSRNILAAALQVPLIDRAPTRVLDVGCGFGEFSRIYRNLGAQVTATEVIPVLAAHVRAAGIDCRLGSLEALDLPVATFDLILFRAVLYRTHRPAETIAIAKRLLAPGGRISILDPSTDPQGVAYFAGKQFPQGRYYIADFTAFSRMLSNRFGLRTIDYWPIYGRPHAPLKRVRFVGNFLGAAELLFANLFRRKPYMAAYLLSCG